MRIAGSTISIILVASFGLSGCVSTRPAPFHNANGTAPMTGPAPIVGEVESVSRDVEAPEIFQATAMGEWDGRPTLGGIWVAHPRARSPERVIIRNQTTGAFAVGTMFRKEPGLPGAEFQVSSSAAKELGLAANQPQNINVTALRSQNAPVQPPQPVAPQPVTPAQPPAPMPAGNTVVQPATPQITLPTAPVSPLSKPYIQIGLFSIQANAMNTAKMLSASNVPMRVLPESLGGKRFWRVLAGPAQTESQRSSFLARIMSLGFGDAFAVKE